MARPVYSARLFSAQGASGELNQFWPQYDLVDYTVVLRSIYGFMPSGIFPSLRGTLQVLTGDGEPVISLFQLYNAGADAAAQASWEGRIVVAPGDGIGILDESSGGEAFWTVSAYLLSPPYVLTPP